MSKLTVYEEQETGRSYWPIRYRITADKLVAMLAEHGIRSEVYLPEPDGPLYICAWHLKRLEPEALKRVISALTKARP